MKMRAARMHGYNQPLEIDEVPVPDVGRSQVLIKVAATGMCRSDYQLMDGYFRDGLPVDFPFIPGHEVSGTITDVGPDVPDSAGISEGDLVVVDPNWGDGTCRQCHEGNQQLCANGQLVGFGPNGGFAEYIRAEIGLLTADERKQRQLDAVAHQADLGQCPFGLQNGCRQSQGLGRPRAVQHRVDRSPPGQVLKFVLDVLARLITHVDGVIRAVFPCHLQLFIAPGESEHGGACAEKSRVLHAIAAETPDAVDDHRAAGAELSRVSQLLHAAIGSKTGIGQRSKVLGLLIWLAGNG